MKAFIERNPVLADTMKAHLITDLDAFGIWSDDYDAFLNRRAAVISQELQKRLIRRAIDEHGQVSRADDFEEMSSFA
jgi:hypothetical protein